MHQLLELVPILLFFIAYKMDGETVELASWSLTFDGLYTATAVLMIATVVQVALTWLITRKIDKKLLWMLAAVLVFGAATLLLRNGLFIQWKPTIFNWGLALVLLGSMLLSDKSFLQRMLESQMQLPRKAWHRLNLLWVSHFTVVGTLNLVVAYQFSEEAWVNFKLYSAIGFTVFLMIATVVILYPFLKDDLQNEAAKQPNSQE